jgi:ABC-2 type transport system ATP-binding protein
MELLEHRNKLAGHLSGGMRKRLDIACSLIHKPKLLLLDEPTADLDPVLQKEILQMLKEVNKQGVTIVFASNQLDTVEEICTKVAVIHNGRVYSQGTLDDIRNPFIKDYFTIRVQRGEEKGIILDYLQQLPVNKVIDQGQNILVYPDDITATLQGLLQVIKAENLNLHNLDVRKPSLKEIFEKIVG